MVDKSESGGGYWRGLEAEEREKRRVQEELERPQLEGRWVSAAKALTLASVSGDVQDAKSFLIASAAQTLNNKPTLRTRAETAQARTQYTTDPVRRNRIVHIYEWDGETSAAFWQTGFFKLRNPRMLGRELTLTNVEFSLDDLEQLIGSHEASSDDDAPAVAKPRRKKFDHAGFLHQAVELLKDEGGFGPDYTRSHLFVAMEKWCFDTWEAQPSRTWIYARFDEAEERFKSSLS